MQTLPRFWGRRRFRRDPGMVLVIILAMIVLVTIAVMAFFTHAVANQQTETSRSNRAEADLLAQSGADYVTSLFLQEIASSANSTSDSQSDFTIFQPRDFTNMVPQRALSSGVVYSNTNFFNLIRQSVPNNSADSNASSHSTATSSRNGRSITPARWNLPLLLGSSGFSTNSQLPNWIYVTRNGGITSTPGTNVIGRFAYNVYDIGGLLNANVAGFPGNISATNVLRLKSSVAGADITFLPGLSGNSAAIEALVKFRNLGTIGSEDSYLAEANAFLSGGYMNTVASNSLGTYTNNFFTSRQDLIRYVRTQNKVLTNALPYLTHFSRSLTGPSWKPVNPSSSTVDYQQEMGSSTGINRSFLTVRIPADTQLGYYSDDGIKTEVDVKEGEPLVQRKFSLAKLAWLTPTGPKTGISSEAIESCFGLRWDGGKERWDYVAYGTSSIDPSPHIKTLGEVAATTPLRAPNFFELLKAGILRGSVGVVQTLETMASDNPTRADQNDRVLLGNRDLQILRIGANIIDCADADNYPTILGMNISTSALSQIIEIPGVEDLPYLNYLSMCGLRRSVPDTTITGRNYRMTECDIVWIPELFNPHAPSNFTTGPASIQFDVLSGVLTYVGCNVGSPNGFPGANLNKSLVGAASAEIINGDFNQFRAGPTAIHQDASAFKVETVIPYFTGSKKDVVVIPVYSYQDEYTFSQSWVDNGYGINKTPGPWGWRFNYNPSSSSGSHFISVQNVVIGLSYRSPSNTQWKTYSTFGGFMVDDVDGVVRPYSYTGLTGLWNGFSWSTTNKYLFAFFPMIPNGATFTDFASQVMFAALWDPRTARLGVGFGQGGRRPLENPTTVSGSVGRINLGFPFATASGNAQNPGYRPQAGLTSTDGWPDADSVYRPADAFLSSSANLFTNPSNYSLRPQLLQRPYRTVGELGYVFRDLPWKSLSFFDSSSPDSALLDIFCVSEEPGVVAGRVSLNARYFAVPASLLSQTPEDITSNSAMSSSLATNVAATLSTKYSFSSGTVTSNVMLSPASLASFMSSATLTNAVPSLSPIKNVREATVRALGEATQTRTWNLFADVIVQVGRFPAQSGTGAGDFVVDAEQRIWLSEAIDRFTGEVVDRSYETVGE